MKTKFHFFTAISLFMLMLNVPDIYSQEEDVKASDLANFSLEDLLNMKIVTASKVAEPMYENPVPVSIITEEMIDAAGTVSFKDVICTYVPGLTNIEDANEYNFTMRGIYTSSQQKILIMVNGHRLNARAFTAAAPDYGISLDKVKQIEILRGPGSSLYGNVALTAVINIITKTGKDVDGGRAKLAIGNYGQRMGSLYYGKSFGEEGNKDVFFWANMYSSEGEPVDIEPENDYVKYPASVVRTTHIDRTKDKPAYDIGANMRFGNFSAFMNLKHGHFLEPFSSVGEGGVFDYDKIRKFNGLGPGFGTQSFHVNVNYDKDLSDDFNISLNIHTDLYEHAGQLLMNTHPDTLSVLALGWKTVDYGFTLQATNKYESTFGSGNLIVGIQAEEMSLFDSFKFGGNNGEINAVYDSKSAPYVAHGKEQVYSPFLQIKHRFTEKWIMNIGARYDIKKRYKYDKTINDLSPRIALIYKPKELFDVKLSYSKAFVDAPFKWRFGGAPFRAPEDMKPEYLTSIQFTPTMYVLDIKLRAGFNVFYNLFEDVVYYAPGVNPDYEYFSSGKLNTMGVELDMAYISKPFDIYANFGQLKVLDAEDYPFKDDKVYHVPSFSANAVASIKPFYNTFDRFAMNLTFKYLGEQLSPLNTWRGGVQLTDPENKVDATFLVNAGIRLKDINGFGCSLQITNLLDTEYYQGGTTAFPYPQKGRWILSSLSYNFK